MYALVVKIQWMHYSGGCQNQAEELEVYQIVKKRKVMNKRPMKVLIVEDDDFNLLILRFLLAHYAEEIIVARNGREAVEKYLSNADMHLVLMDLNMPEMDGFEATSQIRSYNPTVVIVAQTTLNSDSDRQKAQKVGCNSFINKPVSRSIIARLMEKHFCKSGEVHN